MRSFDEYWETDPSEVGYRYVLPTGYDDTTGEFVYEGSQRLGSFVSWAAARGLSHAQRLWNTARPKPKEVGGVKALPVRVVTVIDPDAHLTYTATIDTDASGPYLSSLLITPRRPDQRINHDVLRRIPTQPLAQHIARHFAREDHKFSKDGMGVVTTIGHNDPSRPTLEWIAQARQDGIRIKDIADEWGIGHSTVTALIRKAMDAGLIEKDPRRGGRPRAPKPSGSPRAGTSKRPNRKDEQ